MQFLHLIYNLNSFEYLFIGQFFDFIVFRMFFISLFFYCFGIIGLIFNIKNFLISMFFIEIAYIGLFFGFISSSLFLNNPLGQIYALILLILVACESVIGLGILLILYRSELTITLLYFSRLKS